MLRFLHISNLFYFELLPVSVAGIEPAKTDPGAGRRCRCFGLGFKSWVFVVIMSYQAVIDQMVGKHVADFQAEFSAAKTLQELKFATPMHYGYPSGVYHPKANVECPQTRRYLSHPPGKMSNGVPWLLSMDLADQYVLGVYNPERH